MGATGDQRVSRVEHTQGELTIFDQGARLILASRDAGWSVCSIETPNSMGHDEAVHFANAERISRCWNAHDDLIAITRKLRNALGALRPFPLVVEATAVALIREADAAIAMATRSQNRNAL